MYIYKYEHLCSSVYISRMYTSSVTQWVCVWLAWLLGTMAREHRSGCFLKSARTQTFTYIFYRNAFRSPVLALLVTQYITHIHTKSQKIWLLFATHIISQMLFQWKETRQKNERMKGSLLLEQHGYYSQRRRRRKKRYESKVKFFLPKCNGGGWGGEKKWREMNRKMLNG